ncbi:tetratricopeptide repeat-containing sensor histidine kinase [Mucilaginibacter aquaedulcis]|uniref:tetratricopeptide repeat-containing sensor histidine kinase n=1 Tax=Mucilaginibacter aquaedulcis TaxID=1187081 RepID=UPI0025B5E2A2|nr:tetratricopeptide repeat protein [Mucilaginibacter aquaedulcis]MDN3546745.1 tetratricopeptide repeat protein [Mucilaginibacter aquaedulcis]
MFTVTAFAQAGNLVNLKQKINAFKQREDYFKDTSYLATVNQLGFIYADIYPDSAIALLNRQAGYCKAVGFLKGEFTAFKILGNAYQTKGDFAKSLAYYQQAYQLAKKNGYNSALPGIQNNIGLIYSNQGNYSPALRIFYEALKGAEADHNQFVTGSILNNIGTIHFFQNKMPEAESDYRQMLGIAKETADTVGLIIAYNNIGEIMLERHKPREALTILNIASQLAHKINDAEMLMSSSKTLGDIAYQLDSLPAATAHFNNTVVLAKKQGNLTYTAKALIGLAKVQNKQGMFKPALDNALEALQLAQKIGQVYLLRDAQETVSTVYASMGNGKDALLHYQKFKTYSDSIRNLESERMAMALKADYTFSKKEVEYQRKASQQNWLIFSALAALTTLCIILWIINHNRKKLNQANKILKDKNQVIANEKANTERTLYQLQDTQAQLIQAEKMASLAELTAGIAHEIQNPLNFVNNFSEVSVELLNELKDEIQSGNKEGVYAITNDLNQNLEKIYQHGQRASGIVKSMLEHSKAHKGQKELTDVRKLVSECFNLTYESVQLKDEKFNVELITKFESNLPLVSLIPQDIGRVLINLFNNAFYAMRQKEETMSIDYKPTVKVFIEQEANQIKITVQDNGVGIPDDIKDKIMQPFFTTKPTGEGVGLGLSLSYDIIVKAHNGQFTVETGRGQGTAFTIHLPL